MSDSIFDKRFVVIAGKGGVGKTTIACSLALAASRLGKKVLIIEMTSREKVALLFGRATTSGYNLQEVFAGIHSINVRPEPALKEYAIMKLRWERVYRMVFDNEIMRSMVKMLPGMNELVLIGKSWHLEQEKDPATGDPRWDMVIVDAPATGHGISLLMLPHVITNTITTGPMLEETWKIRELLTDHERTCMSIVTLPEEMPVNEAADLYALYDEPLQIGKGPMFINRVWPAKPTESQMALHSEWEATDDLGTQAQAAISAMRFRAERRGNQETYLKRIKNEFDLPIVEVPFIFTESFDLDAIDELSGYIDVSLDRIDNAAGAAVA
ncbi:MAG TPA: chromosome partitioning protein [Myxococcales bacterium]|nr:chromosome partitioning protein [Myxococcales bacterium]